MTSILKFSDVLEEIRSTEKWSKHRAFTNSVKKMRGNHPKITQLVVVYYLVLSLIFNENLQGSGAEWPKLKLQLFVDDREPLFQG